MTALSKLKREHSYKNKTETNDMCRNCQHFKQEEAYEGVEGMSGKVCRLYRDDDEDAGVIILMEDFGVCDAHE